MTVQWYSCDTGQAVYWQLSERTRKSNLLQMLLFTKAALYPQLFKEPECWFSWGLNQQPLAQHTRAYPIELSGQLEVMSLSVLPISLVAVTHLNILNIWLRCHYFYLPFTDLALSMYNNYYTLIKDGCLWHFIPLHTYERLLLYILGVLHLF